MDINEIDYICTNIDKTKLGGFLDALIEAWLSADLPNKVILQWAMSRIITKYPDAFKIEQGEEKAAS
jgi:hypothetical protein